ncbi:MAG TPA: hypothetical protein VFG00_03225, partial [Acidothermaceae bacterium]|nr:hypothetical protein [Acidothermaceae bacterium]
MRFACRPVIRGLAAVVLLLGLVAVGELTAHIQARADVPPLPAGTLCQGPQASQPASGPTHVINIVLENESTANVESSPDATFERGTLDAQCGTFSQTAMHSTTHYSARRGQLLCADDGAQRSHQLGCRRSSELRAL